MQDAGVPGNRAFSALTNIFRYFFAVTRPVLSASLFYVATKHQSTMVGVYHAAGVSDYD